MPNTVGAGPIVDELVARGVRLIRDYATANGTKTDLLKELASVIVELRRGFQTEDGRTDWAGRSYAYRETVATIYSQSGLSPDALEGMQAALRYHIGNVLREAAPADELDALGLKAKRPVERVKDTRDRLAALARVGAAQEGTGNPRADVVRMVMGAEVVLSRVDEIELADLEPDMAEAVETTLEALVERATKLLTELRDRK